MSIGALLATWSRPEFNYYFAATKPLDHQPFGKQVAKHLAVSFEVTYGGVQTQLSTLTGTGSHL